MDATPHQRFRQDEIIDSIVVRKDKTIGETYNRVSDIQRIFSGASLFKINGVHLNYLEDQHEQVTQRQHDEHPSMDEYQNFQCGSNIQSLAVRWDTTRQYHYSRLKDVQEVFPNAVRFKRRVQVLTSPPLQGDQPVFSPPPPSSLPELLTTLFAQTSTTQRSPSPPPHLFPASSTSSPSPPLDHSPASSPSPESDVESMEDVTAVTNSIVKENIAAAKPIVKKISISKELRQLIAKNNGTYDEDAGKIALTLTSTVDLRQFFNKLVKDAKKTRELDVTLDYDFGASDSENMVNKIYRTDIAILRLDLKGTWDETPEQIKESLNLKYHKIHTLLWDKNLKGLILENATHFGLRANLPPVNKLYSGLRLLHFLIKIESSSESQLCTLLLACPNLHDLRLGNFQTQGQIHPKMEVVIGNLKKLKTLHIYNTNYSPDIPEEDKTNHRWKTIPQSDRPIKNIVRTGHGVNQARLQAVIGRSAGVIEVLMLQYPKIPNRPLELRASDAIDQPYVKLTHLDLQVVLSPNSLAILRETMPQLNLTHLGVNCHSKELLKHVKFETLTSISLTDLSEADLSHIRSESLRNFRSWKIKTIRLRDIDNIEALMFLLALPMRRIFLSKPSIASLKGILTHLDFSELEVLSILTPEYDWSTEAILATQAAKFNDRMKVELCRPHHDFKSDIYDENARPLVGTNKKLARGRVEILSIFLQHERYIQAILPAHSIGK
ncbi:hypothetical protein KI688_000693 [Linnemannia hyalina]|uniref:RNI-like protein n=1 Tax=Linnemannia hyalina TaxID=64524 RepID=A0A9P8C019_9FUNG|nr:hypothetical protein KI688_000693 [Linnemannia hyalina]